MKVELINFTEHARELLLFTKATRLSQDASLFGEIDDWPEEKKNKELAYILGTIQSSWEFVDYVFCISGVSRGFTHQFVRTRDGDIGPDEVYIGPRHKTIASFAQQSQRTVDMSGAGFITPKALSDSWAATVQFEANHIGDVYSAMVHEGVKPQDARSILPTNVSTNIIAKFNLRTLSEMAKLRLCSRTQGEYQDVFRAMRRAVMAVHPWAEPFLRVHCAAVGVCCFPNYSECPIKPGQFNPETGKLYPGTRVFQHTVLEIAAEDIEWRYPMSKAQIQEAWERMDFEATPKQMEKDGNK